MSKSLSDLVTKYQAVHIVHASRDIGYDSDFEWCLIRLKTSLEKQIYNKIKKEVSLSGHSDKGDKE